MRNSLTNPSMILKFEIRTAYSFPSSFDFTRYTFPKHPEPILASILNACSKYDTFLALSYTLEEGRGVPCTLSYLRVSFLFKNVTFWVLVSSNFLLNTRDTGGHVFACGFGGG